MNKPISLQMYTLRNECEENFVETLEKVAALGFEGVEFAGYYGLSSAEVKELLNRLNLKVSSSHISIDKLENDLENVIQFEKEIGNTRIVCPFLPPERRNKEEYTKLVSTFNQIGKRLAEEGMTFSYHNHDFELERFDGKTGLEIIFDGTNPEYVKAEFDIYWLKRAGEDPVEWIKKYSDRTPLVHLKDMTTDGEQLFAELGTGGIDLQPVLDQGKNSNVEWWVIEQDQCKGSPLESIEKSINYLKTLDY
jgi:sugar phosphate isomerase/epimerase